MRKHGLSNTITSCLDSRCWYIIGCFYYYPTYLYHGRGLSICQTLGGNLLDEIQSSQLLLSAAVNPIDFLQRLTRHRLKDLRYLASPED